MRKFIAVVVPTEAKAAESLHALRELHAAGTITIYETIVIGRQADGTISTEERATHLMRRTGIGTLLGALIGLFGGPAGVIIGGSIGGVAGSLDETIRWSVSDEYVDAIGRQLARGTFAVLAEVHEKGSRAVDARMEAIGGKVLRETRAEFFADILEKLARTRRAELDEHRVARDSEKAEHMRVYLESDLHDARLKLQRTAQDAREQLDQTKAELDDKLDALEDQIARATPEVRRDLEDRVSEIQRDLLERERKLSRALQIAEDALRQ